MDPGITSVFKKMLVYQELLVDSPVSGAYINKLMHELDDDWRELMGHRALFTGMADFPPETDPKGERTTGVYVDESVFFQGVIPCEDEDKNISMNEDDPKHYHLRIAINRVKDGVLTHGTARPEDVMGLDFPYLISLERSRHVLENFQPGLFYDLDESLAKPAEHEGAVARRLRKYFYDQAEDDPDTVQLTTLSLNRYTNCLLDFDRNIGYLVALKGRGWIDGNDKSEVYKFSQASPAIIDKVIWRESPKQNDSTIVPHLVMKLCTENINETSDTIHFPLTSVKDIVPLRHVFIPKNS